MPKVLSSFLAVGACWGPPTIIFARGLFLGQTLFWHDIGIAFLPFRSWAVRCFQAGDLPTWCPLVGTGAAMLAEGQGGTLYPTNLVAHLLGLPVWWDYTFQCWLHIGLAASLTYLWLRRGHGMSWLASVIAAHTFSLSGYMVGHIMHLPMLQVMAWLPAGQWSCEVIAREGGEGRRGVAGLAAVVGLGCLAGHPQTLWYLLLGSTIWMVVHMRRGSRAVAIGRFAAAVGLGLAFGAVQTVPTGCHAAFSERRKAGDIHYVRRLSLTWRSLANFVHPEIYGSYADGNYFGGDHHYEVCGWTGGAALLLALVAASSGRRRRLRTAALVLVPVALFFALARYNPAYRILAWIPPLGMFRAAGRYVVLVTMGIAVLAAVGVDELALSKRARKAAVCIGLVVVVGWLAAPHLIRAATPILRPVLIREALVRSGGDEGLASVKAAEKIDFFVRRTRATDPYVAIWLLTAAALVGAGGWVARNGVLGRAALGICGAAGLAHLMLLGYWYHPWLAERRLLHAGRMTVAWAEAMGWKGSGYFYSDPALPAFSKRQPWRPYDAKAIASWARAFFAGLRPSSNVLADARCLGSNLPLAPASLLELAERRVPRSLAGTDRVVRVDQVLRALGVGIVITTGDRAKNLQAITVQRAPEIGPDVVLCMLEDADQALAWIPREVRFVHSSGEAVDQMCAADYTWPVALVERAEVPWTSRAGGTGRVLSASWLPTGGFEAEVVMDEPGWLVIAAAYDPGWRVWVDGSRAKLFRANALISALELGAGRHRIVMHYYCPGLRVGLAVSLLGLAALVLVWWWRQRLVSAASRA